MAFLQTARYWHLHLSTSFSRRLRKRREKGRGFERGLLCAMFSVSLFHSGRRRAYGASRFWRRIELGGAVHRARRPATHRVAAAATRGPARVSGRWPAAGRGWGLMHAAGCGWAAAAGGRPWEPRGRRLLPCYYAANCWATDSLSCSAPREGKQREAKNMAYWWATNSRSLSLSHWVFVY